MEPLRLRARQTFSVERGFTLVELLVILLIVGILAAVALPTFLDQKSKSQDTEAKWMAAVAAQALLVWHQDHDTYAGATPERLEPIEPTIRQARGITLEDLSATDYTVSVASAAGASGGGPYTIEHRSGTTRRTCAEPGRGSCPDSGLW